MPDSQSINMMLNAYGLSSAATGGFNWAWLLANIIFSIIGFYAFMHGRKERQWRPMVIGIALIAYLYFVYNPLLVFAIGIALTAALYFWRE